jgi:hypothetical protein
MSRRLNTASLVVARSDDHSLTVVAQKPVPSRDRQRAGAQEFMTRCLITLGAKLALVGFMVALPLRATPVLTQVSNPYDDNYLTNTTLFDISGITGGTAIPNPFSILSFSTPMIKLSVPSTWATWGGGMNVESVPCVPTLPTLPLMSCPPVLWSNGSNILTITLTSAVQEFGFELQPDNPEVETIKVTFITNDSAPDLSFMIPVNGFPTQPTPTTYSGGAMLFAAVSTAPDIKAVTVQDLGPGGNGCPTGLVCDFAIAELRAQVPEPGTVGLVGAALCGLGLWRRKRARRRR